VLIHDRDQHEAECAPWLTRLERALETERFNSFWIDVFGNDEIGAPADVVDTGQHSGSDPGAS